MKIIWIIVAVLLALWLAGLVMDVAGGLIHVILVIVIALAIFGFIKRRV